MRSFSRFTWPPGPGRTVLLHETCRSDSCSYVYDASGQRVEKTTASGSVYYLYDLAGHVVTEINSSGNWDRTEIYAGAKHLATYAGGTNGTTYFDHVDWLGTPRRRYRHGAVRIVGIGPERVRTDAQGALAETCRSLPFGDGLSCSGSDGDPSPLHFTGDLPRRGRGQHDSETGLALFASRMALRDDYFGARYDSSSLGRFMTPDWSGKVEPVPYAKLGDPQSLNLYAYSGNNPLLRPDRNGHCWPVCTVIAGAALGATAGFVAELGSEYLKGGHYSAAKLRHAAEAGAVTGAVAGLAGPEAGLLVKAGLSVAGSELGGALERHLNHEKTSVGSVVLDAVGGVAGTAADTTAESQLTIQAIRKGTSTLTDILVDTSRRATSHQEGSAPRAPSTKPPKQKCTATGVNGCPLPPPATSSQPSTGPSRT